MKKEILIAIVFGLIGFGIGNSIGVLEKQEKHLEIYPRSAISHREETINLLISKELREQVSLNFELEQGNVKEVFHCESVLYMDDVGNGKDLLRFFGCKERDGFVFTPRANAKFIPVQYDHP